MSVIPPQSVLQIDALLPQTQCGRCGYGGCLPYAEAIAAGTAAINRCPPGGDQGIKQLAALLEREVLPLDPECGAETPRSVVRIEPEHCIGCTKCIQACPVDAIMGASKRMHTVIAELCTGCELCLPPCPVDCIVIEPLPAETPAWSKADAQAARARFLARNARLVRLAQRRAVDSARRAQLKLESLAAEPQDDLTARKRSIIEAAIQRSRERAAVQPDPAKPPSKTPPKPGEAPP